MTQIYSNPKLALDPHALPDVEVFWHDVDQTAEDPDTWLDGDGEPLPAGWYWWSCFPGCLPDSDPFGPFATEQEAIDDAQSEGDDEETD